MENDKYDEVIRADEARIKQTAESVANQVKRLRDPWAKDFYTAELNAEFRKRIDELASRRYSLLDTLFYTDRNKANILQLSITILDRWKADLERDKNSIPFIRSAEEAACRREQHSDTP